MKKANLTISLLTLALPLVAVSCNNPSPASSASDASSSQASQVSSEATTSLAPSSSKVEETEITLTRTMAPSLRKKDSTKTEDYTFTFTKKVGAFAKSATIFDKDLALLTYGAAMTTHTEADAKGFFQELKFDDVETHIPETRTKDTIAYSFAHGAFDGYDVVALTIDGLSYGREWVNNLELGASGHHAGFEKRANEVYAALKTYLAKHQGAKLWLTGYSRGGAVANMVSHFILSKGEIEIAKENMFVYTFETPKGLTVENKADIAYPNVFNIINSRDFITYIAPEKQFGFSRCGIDIDLYSERTNETIVAFDEDISIPDFVCKESADKFTDEPSCIEYVFDSLTKAGPEEDDGYIYFQTREEFATLIQKPIQTAIDVAFSFPKETIDHLISDVKAIIDKNPLDLLSILATENGVYDFIKPYLEEAKYQFDEEDMKQDTEVLRKYVYGKLAFLILLVPEKSELRPDLMRVVYMHFPEIPYILLKAYEAPVQTPASNSSENA